MKLRIIVGAAATAVALSSGLALAQAPATGAPHGQGSFSDAAFIGSGSDSGYLQHQQQLQNDPGYNIGGNG